MRLQNYFSEKEIFLFEVYFIVLHLKTKIMAETGIIPVHERIKEALDGRTNKWLKDKLAEKGFKLNDSQMSQRLAGNTDFTGDETIACFEILNMDIKPESA